MADAKKSKSDMIIDGVFASEAIDSSGEVVSIKGMDVSTMEEGYGVANYEHLGDDGNYGREIVGKIVYVKKIYDKSDCEDDRQRKYCEKLKGIPFLYGVVRLYDGAGHQGAQALAAQMRDAVAHDEPIIVRYSIEGTTLEKDGNKIKNSLAKRVALTLKPCNRTCVSGIVADPNAPDGFAKMESEPGYARLSKSDNDLEILDFDPTLHLRLIAHAATAAVIRKSTEAGSPDAAPSALTGGAALQREDVMKHVYGTAMLAMREWGDRPYVRDDFKAFTKAKLPEVSDEFLDHFADIAEQYTLKKDEGEPKKRAKPSKGLHPDHPLAQHLAASAAKPAPAAPAKKPDRYQQAQNAQALEAIRGSLKDQGLEEKHPVLEDITDAQESDPYQGQFKVRTDKNGKQTKQILWGTRRGKKMTPNLDLNRSHFDAEKGMFHTPIGSFPAYLPEHDGPESHAEFMRVLKDPKTENVMDHALENWHAVHELNKAGKLPPEIVMHGVVFSQFSPNRSVQTQETQFARFHDALRITGADPRQPGLKEKVQDTYAQLDRPDVLPETSREAFRTNPAYYMGGKIGVETDAQGNKLGKPSDATGRYPGELLSTQPFFDQDMDRIGGYHKVHDKLNDIVQRHGADSMGGISELMSHKAEKTRYENRRRIAVSKGQPDPGPFQGQHVPGLKVKTGLYAYGMMGGGQSVVPDTHFIRHVLGLHLEKDADTIEYLKQQFWNPNNIDRVMKPLNDWYAKNHPAYKNMVEHPRWGKMFKDNPRNALFPAFWHHWVGIGPHESFMGMPHEGGQAETNHAPYWDVIRPHVERAQGVAPSASGGEVEREPGADDEAESGRVVSPEDEALFRSEPGMDTTVPMRTAMAHQQYVRDYGEVPAQMMYYAFLVPKLLKAAKHREDTGLGMEFLAKSREMEAQVVELRKSVREVLEGGLSDAPKVHQVMIQRGETLHPAGRYLVHRGNVEHLEDYHGILGAMVPEGPVTDVTASRLHGLEFAPHIVVAPHELPVQAQPVAPEGVQVTEASAPARPPVFEYHRSGHQQPHVVEFGKHGAAIDGRKLDDAELDLILENVHNGVATMRYKSAGAPMAKAEGDPSALDDDLDEVLQHYRGLVARGLAPPEHERIMTAHIMGDPMVAGVGNKRAWMKFQQKQKPGVYASIDLNDFKHVNDVHGHQAGDEAITAAGNALRSAADKVGTGHLFRPGGDEFVAHFPTYEEAARFSRHAREHFDKLPAVNGVHRQSFSLGLGQDFKSADKALGTAKERKFVPGQEGVESRLRQRNFAPGHTPHLAHSNVPGAEGPLMLQEAAPPSQHMPAPATKPVAQAAPKQVAAP